MLYKLRANLYWYLFILCFLSSFSLSPNPLLLLPAWPWPWHGWRVVLCQQCVLTQKSLYSFTVFGSTSGTIHKEIREERDSGVNNGLVRRDIMKWKSKKSIRKPHIGFVKSKFHCNTDFYFSLFVTIRIWY